MSDYIKHTYTSKGISATLTKSSTGYIVYSSSINSGMVLDIEHFRKREKALEKLESYGEEMKTITRDQLRTSLNSKIKTLAIVDQWIEALDDDKPIDSGSKDKYGNELYYSCMVVPYTTGWSQSKKVLIYAFYTKSFGELTKKGYEIKDNFRGKSRIYWR